MTEPAPPKPAADFASAAMLRVLAQGMRELGLKPEPAAGLCAEGVATVPLDEKRRLVGSALAQGGIGCLALLGRGLHRHAHEPTHRALVSARDPGELFARWARLERYIHSRHRIELRALGEGHADIVHLAPARHPAPLPAEDLVVLGVLVALLEAVGAEQVSASIERVPVYPEPDAAALAALARQERTAAWCIAWKLPAAMPLPRREHAARTPRLVAPPTWPDHAQRSFLTLSTDLMSPMGLSALARALGEAPRSLQRRLSDAGLSYTRLLAQARCSSASWWLMKTATPIAEVGFISGYADQPHFTRDFRHRVGMTPQRFRSDFCEPAGRLHVDEHSHPH
jgi:AraC-like DNA-binding protein